MRPETFSHCLSFFRKHYRIVSPRQVFAALNGEIPLPQRSLLVTFDDGWADTAEYAQPLLDKFGITALVFVAAGAIGSSMPFWEERVYDFLATRAEGRATLDAALALHNIPPIDMTSGVMNETQIRGIIKQLDQLQKGSRDAVLARLKTSEALPPAMLGTHALKRLAESGHGIGGHGFSHQALTKVIDAPEELHNSRIVLSSHLDGDAIESMSFPHGAYSDDVVAKSRAAGFRYLFSSDACLNRVDVSVNGPRPVGRIHISERAITDRTGRFDPVKLATWLFLRPARKITHA
jgi:peptidoglycan/xylan/chitin deacetylase (PgdA/CDA1 family)